MSDRFLTTREQKQSWHAKGMPHCVVRYQSTSASIYAGLVHGKTPLHHFLILGRSEAAPHVHRPGRGQAEPKLAAGRAKANRLPGRLPVRLPLLDPRSLVAGNEGVPDDPGKWGREVSAFTCAFSKLERLTSLRNTSTGNGSTRDWRTESFRRTSNRERREQCTVVSGLEDCFAPSIGMPHEINDSNFWTLRV